MKDNYNLELEQLPENDDLLRQIIKTRRETTKTMAEINGHILELREAYTLLPALSCHDILSELDCHRDFRFRYDHDAQMLVVNHIEGSRQLSTSISVIFTEDGASLSGAFTDDCEATHSELLAESINLIVMFDNKLHDLSRKEEELNIMHKFSHDVDVLLLTLDIMARNPNRQNSTFYNAMLGEMSLLKVKQSCRPRSIFIDDISPEHLEEFLNEELVEIYESAATNLSTVKIAYSIFEFLDLVIENIFINKKQIKICPVCKRFFVPEYTGKEKYCKLPRFSYYTGELDVSCSQEAKVTQNTARRHSTVAGKRDLLTNRLRSRGSYSGDYSELFNFQNRDYDMRDKLKTGEITEAEYCDFLDAEDKKAGIRQTGGKRING